MFTDNAEQARREWEPVFPDTPDHESEIARRVRSALIEVSGEVGYEDTTLEAVLDRAGIERAEFDAEFESFDECRVDTWVHVIREFLVRTEAAFDRGGGDWREGMRYQAWDLLRYVEEDIKQARFLIELAFGDEMVQANRDRAMSRITDFVDLGRFEGESAAQVPRATAEALIGAVWNGLAMNIGEPPNSDVLRSGSPQILYLMMMAYVGEEAAREELARAPEDLARYERGEL